MRSGDTCPQCGEGRMKVITSCAVNDGQHQQQWYKCEACGESVKVVVSRSTVCFRKILRKNCGGSTVSESH